MGAQYSDPWDELRFAAHDFSMSVLARPGHVDERTKKRLQDAARAFASRFSPVTFIRCIPDDQTPMVGGGMTTHGKEFIRVQIGVDVHVSAKYEANGSIKWLLHTPINGGGVGESDIDAATASALLLAKVATRHL